MKPKLILISHGHFAEQAHKSAEMIMGKIEDLHAISMLEDDGLDGTKAKLNAVFEEIGNGTPAVIVADMMSGTPCNVAVHAMYERENIRLITGLNLPMLIEYAVYDGEDIDEMATFLQEVGNEAVKVVKKTVVSDEDEGYED